MAVRSVSLEKKKRSLSGKFSNVVFCCARPHTTAEEVQQEAIHTAQDEDNIVTGRHSSIFSDFSSIFNSSTWGLRSIRSIRLRHRVSPWELPPSVIVRILSISSARSVAACACVCSTWRKSATCVGIREFVQIERILSAENVQPNVVSTNENYTRTSGRLGELVALGGQGFLSIWDLKERDLAVRCEAEELSIRALIFTQDLLLTGDDDGNLCGWDHGSGELKLKTPIFDQTISAIVNLNQSVGTTGSGTSEIKILDKSHWECEKVLKGHKDGVSCLGSACNGARIVVGCFVGSIRVWDVKLGECVLTLLGHRKAVSCVDSFEGFLASGSNDLTVRVWDLTSGECVSVLEGHWHFVRAIALHRCFVVSGSQDKTVRVWNFKSGECLTTIDVGSLAKSIWMDDDGLVVVTSDSQIIGWKLDTD